MPDPGSTIAQKTRVFISYARADVAFADRLAAALEAHDYKVLIDRQSLPTLEDWRRELLVLIRKADTVVFIVSPRSIASPVCQWEVEQMAALDKRLAPVVLERVANDKIPHAITRINYLFFDPPNDFKTQAEALARAFATDIGWWHEHTRLVELAGHWARDGRPDDQLLRSGSITAAQSWASRRPDKAQIPDVVFQLLDASLKKEEHDREELNEREFRISERTQRTIADLARRASDEHRYPSALRLALSGEPSDDERARGVAPEASRRAQLARAAHSTLGVASADKTARIWDATSGVELVRLDHDAKVRWATFNPAGDRIVTVSDAKTARIWDAASGGALVSLAHDDKVLGAAFSPEGSHVVTASADKTARIWDAASGVELIRLAHGYGVTSAAFSDDGTRVVTFSGDEVRIWDSGSGAEELCIAQRDEFFGRALSPSGAVVIAKVSDAALSPNGAVVAIATDRITGVWDARSGVELARFTPDGTVSSAAFSPEGERVVTASGDTVQIWDSDSGSELMRFDHDDWATSAAFSPDGACVLTASMGGTARLWDAASGVELVRLVHGSWVTSAAFSPDGTCVVTASLNGKARIWDVSWASSLRDDALVRAVARARLVGRGRLTYDELRILRPLLSGVEPDVVSRWLEPSPDDAEVDSRLAQWRRHRELALMLARKDWAARAATINAGFAKTRAARVSGSAISNPAGAPEPPRAHLPGPSVHPSIERTKDDQTAVSGSAPAILRRTRPWLAGALLVLLLCLAVLVGFAATDQIDVRGVIRRLVQGMPP